MMQLNLFSFNSFTQANTDTHKDSSTQHAVEHIVCTVTLSYYVSTKVHIL